MEDPLQMVERIEIASQQLLGSHEVRSQIARWCDEFRQAANDIMHDRGVSLPCFGIIGAKGQGKTWIARQLVLDPAIAQLLPSGVLSKEATTRLHWIGPSAPEALDNSREVYLAVPSKSMLDFQKPYMVLDTPGYTDEDPTAAAIAKEAMSLAPIKLLVARRDQLRSAIHVQLAALTEGSVCLPVITCVPQSDSGSLRKDIEWYSSALSSSAPGTRFLEPVLVPDFEALGDETGIAQRMRLDLQARLAHEDLKVASATKSARLRATSDRLRKRVSEAIENQVPELASAISQLANTADTLPSQAIEMVLGSKQVLRNAIRDRIRGELISGTGLFWFPYRTILGVLGFTHGAWDRLILSMTGSLPSIFGTFMTWAKNLTATRAAHQELQEGIKDYLTKQIQDRLLPAQHEFYRAIDRIGGASPQTHRIDSGLRVRMSGIDALQLQARGVFDETLSKYRIPRWLLQTLGLLASLVFWGLMAGPILAIYRQYFLATIHAWSAGTKDLSEFPSPKATMMFTAFGISTLPVLILAMLVMSWFQRAKRLDAIAEEIYSAELQKVESLKRDGTIKLYYEDPLLQSAEYLTSL